MKVTEETHIQYTIKPIKPRSDTGDCTIFTVSISFSSIEYFGIGRAIIEENYFDCIGHDSDYFEILERVILT